MLIKRLEKDKLSKGSDYMVGIKKYMNKGVRSEFSGFLHFFTSFRSTFLLNQ